MEMQKNTEQMNQTNENLANTINVLNNSNSKKNQYQIDINDIEIQKSNKATKRIQEERIDIINQSQQAQIIFIDNKNQNEDQCLKNILKEQVDQETNAISKKIKESKYQFLSKNIRTQNVQSQIQGLFVHNFNGQQIEFYSLFKEKKAMIVFIRQFQCFVCKDFVEALSNIPFAKLQQQNVDIFLITNSSWEGITLFSQITNFPASKIYSDYDKNIFKRLGLKITGMMGNMSKNKSKETKSNLFTGLTHVLKSYFRNGFKGDVFQQGGTFLCGPGPYFHFQYKDEDPEGHIGVDDILILLQVWKMNSLDNQQDKNTQNKAQKKQIEMTSQDFLKKYVCKINMEKQLDQFFVQNETGEKILFKEFYANKKCVILFIRHFQCYVCRDFVVALSKIPWVLLDQLNVDLKLVSNSGWEGIREFSKLTGFPSNRLFVDTQKLLFNKLNLIRAKSPFDLMPAQQAKETKTNMISGLGHVFKGYTIKGFAGDAFQQGGTFLFSPDQNIYFNFRDSDPEGHISYESLLQLFYLANNI